MKHSTHIIISLLLLVLAAGCQAQGNSERLYRITDTQGKQFGFIDKDGNIVVEPTFDFADEFSEGMCAVKQDGKWGFVDKDGDIVVEPIYDLASSFSEGLCAVKQEGEWGFIDTTGKMVISPQFLDCKGFHEGMCAVGFQKHKWGFINRKGELVIPPVYDIVEDFSDGLAYVQRGSYDYCNFINKDGKLIFCLKSNVIDMRFSDGFCRYGKLGEYGFIYKNDKEWEKDIPRVFMRADRFEHGLAIIQLTEKYRESHWGVIDTTMNWVIKPEARREGFDIKIINQKLIALCKGKWGIVNIKGDTVADFVFDYIECQGIEEGAPIPVKVGNKWGYIGLNGKFVINPIYEYARPFKGDLAAVYDSDYENSTPLLKLSKPSAVEGSYINKKGKIVYKGLIRY